VLALERGVHNIEGRSAAQRMIEDAVQQAEQRAGDSADSAELRVATARRAAHRCTAGGEPAVSVATLRSTIEQVTREHGATSVELEALQLALASCLRAARDLSAASAARLAVYDIAAAREQPPSTQLMHRAMEAFDAAMGARQLERARELHRSVIDNAEAIPEPDLRQRLTAPARMAQICLLAQAGEFEAAVRVAGPLIADSDAVYAKVRRLTPRQGDLWTCLSQAQREHGQHEQALKTVATFIERCSTTPLSPVIALTCRGDALIERALIELDTGHIVEAQATMAERLAMSRDTAQHRTYALAHGRVLLASGQAALALEPLRRHHDEWAALQPRSPYTAEALYWLGRAHLAAGEPRGRSMVEQARVVLASSPVGSHRRLAADLPQR
jgi:hypothetical protein